jgi:hypothetical protein
MAGGEFYRIMAAELEVQAKEEINTAARAVRAELAQIYACLAEHAAGADAQEPHLAKRRFP